MAGHEFSLHVDDESSRNSFAGGSSLYPICLGIAVLITVVGLIIAAFAVSEASQLKSDLQEIQQKSESSRDGYVTSTTDKYTMQFTQALPCICFQGQPGPQGQQGAKGDMGVGSPGRKGFGRKGEMGRNGVTGGYGFPGLPGIKGEKGNCQMNG